MNINEKVKEYAELKRMAAELADMLEVLETEIKEAMGEAEELSVEGIKVSWTRYTASRFDSKTFKAEHAAMYEQYVKRSAARRFQVVA